MVSVSLTYVYNTLKLVYSYHKIWIKPNLHVLLCDISNRNTLTAGFHYCCKLELDAYDYT